MIGAQKKNSSYLHDWVWKKLSGWKEKTLSHAAKEILIKLVIQIIPTYVTSYFLLPVSIVDSVTSLIRQFWWGGTNQN